MDSDEYQQWQIFYEVEAREIAEQERHGAPRAPAGSKKVVTDPGLIGGWFAANANA